jgi:uncharacterized protein YdeI (BOF family)
MYRTVIAATTAVLFAQAAHAQSAVGIGQLASTDNVVIDGTVEQVFGNKFLLKDNTGVALVDTGPRSHATRTFVVGERLKVRGKLDNSEFEARQITRADGAMETIRPDRGPPPWAGRKQKDRD